MKLIKENPANAISFFPVVKKRRYVLPKEKDMGIGNHVTSQCSISCMKLYDIDIKIETLANLGFFGIGIGAARLINL